MNQVQQTPTEGAHQNLRNILLNGRVLINGLPLTGGELGSIVQGEQMLYEKASQLDKTSAPAASEKAKKKPPQEPKIIPIKKEK